MIELSRRGFILGCMASAGVVAVGLPVGDFVNQIIDPPRPEAYSIEFGDLWIVQDGAHQFIGKTRSIRRVEDTPAMYGIFGRGEPQEIRGIKSLELYADLDTDKQGATAIHETFSEGGSLKVLAGTGKREWIEAPGFLRSVDLRCRDEEFYSGQVCFVATGEPVYTAMQ